MPSSTVSTFSIDVAVHSVMEAERTLTRKMILLNPNRKTEAQKINDSYRKHHMTTGLPIKNVNASHGSDSKNDEGKDMYRRTRTEELQALLGIVSFEVSYAGEANGRHLYRSHIVDRMKRNGTKELVCDMQGLLTKSMEYSRQFSPYHGFSPTSRCICHELFDVICA